MSSSFAVVVVVVAVVVVGITWPHVVVYLMNNISKKLLIEKCVAKAQISNSFRSCH